MGISHISTLAAFQNSLNNSKRVQAELFTLQDQISSGLKSKNFAGLSGSVESFSLLGDKISRGETYKSNNDQIVSRLQTTNTSVAKVIETSNAIRDLIVTQRSAANNPAFQQQLASFKALLNSQLNANQEGRYLFGGSQTNLPPVKEPTPDPVEAGVPDANYYQGSTQNITARVQDNYEIVYNVRADDPAFQKIYAALALANENPANDEALAKASTLISEGLREQIALQAGVNANIVAIGQINEQHEDLGRYYKDITSEISNTDIVTAATLVAQNQATLQASFQVFARIVELKLSDFLQ